MIAALVTGCFGVIMYFMRRFDARNTAQHGENKRSMEDIAAEMHLIRTMQIADSDRHILHEHIAEETNEQVHEVRNKLDRHLAWHVEHPGGV